MNARWRPLVGKKPGVELRCGRLRLVVELEHYGYYSWTVQIDAGLCVSQGCVKRRLPGDVTSPVQWVGVSSGHTTDGIVAAQRAAQEDAARLRDDLGGLG
jgi:hypothetical protein